ncbi:MAG: nicotinate-nucleotide adenylyltransferase [Pseudomonadota bacterium]
MGAALGGHLPVPGQRVGLLGGSFNPAHAGHFHISKEALKRLSLHEIWWLVSPQNPLKSTCGMAPLDQRLAGARRVARHPRIRVTAIETLLESRYTAETLRRLQKRFPGVSFVWLMGADNMIQISRWHDWQSIFRQLPVAVFARPSYSMGASSSKAACRFRDSRLVGGAARGLARRSPPAWAFYRIRLSGLSATRLRQAAQ